MDIKPHSAVYDAPTQERIVPAHQINDRISISVIDSNSQRAAAIATACADELNSLMTALSTSAAHRERIFLKERLTVVKQDLETELQYEHISYSPLLFSRSAGESYCNCGIWLLSVHGTEKLRQPVIENLTIDRHESRGCS